MKKIVFLLLLSVGLVSLVEAKCNRTYVTNLINQGFSVEQVVRICRTSDKYKTHYKKQKKSASHGSKSHHAKHKKRKKHHKKLTNSKTSWLQPVPKAICTKYTGSSIVGKGLCRARYKEARKICRAMGGRLPAERELLHSCDSCTHIVPAQKGATYIYNQKIRHKYEKCTGKLGFKIGRSFWSSTSRGRGRVRVVHFPIEPNFPANDNGVNGNISSVYGYYVRCVAR